MQFAEAILVVTNCTLVLILRISLVCDCRHRVLVADQGGQNTDDLLLHY